MKVLIFGANGKIGRVLTERALQRHHQVTGFVYGQAPNEAPRERLTYIQGDATDAKAVEKAMPGHDAVISVLGHGRKTAVEMQSQAMRVITASMQKHDVTRIVSLTGAGVFTEGDSPSLLDRLFVSGLLFLDPKRIQDGIKHCEVLKDSQADWVVLRTPKHRTTKNPKPYRLVPSVAGARMSVARHNIAEALLDLAEAESVDVRMPVLDR